MIPSTFVVILVATVLAKQVDADLDDKFREKMDQGEIQKCVESTGYNPQGPPPKDPKDFTPEQMCFFKCVMESVGLLDANGKVDQAELEKMPIPADKMSEAKQCSADAGKVETCEDMMKLFACIPEK